MIKKTQTAISESEKWITSLIPETYVFHHVHACENQKNKFLLLLFNETFLSKIGTMRKNFNIPSKGFNNKEAAIRWANKIYSSSSLKKSYRKSLSVLLAESKISRRWENAIQSYIAFNKKDIDPIIPPPFEVAIVQDEEGANENRLMLRIFEDTTLDEIKYFWPEIENHKALINHFDTAARNDFEGVNTPDRKGGITKKYVPWIPRRKKIPNIHLYTKVFEMHQRGATSEEIIKEIRMPGKSYTYNDISKLLNEIKTLAEKIVLY